MSTDEEVESCHTARVNQLMKNMENMNVDELKQLSATYDSTYFHQKCDKAARFALGSSIELMDEIMTDKIDNGFAIIRPPGHHAMHDEPNGYCYFNNAAVVAKLAIDKYKLERVLIIDWDGLFILNCFYLLFHFNKLVYYLKFITAKELNFNFTMTLGYFFWLANVFFIIENF